MQGGSYLFQQVSNLQRPPNRLQLAITGWNMQPNIPVVFHLSGKDWASLEAQIRVEFCVIFFYLFILSSPNSAV